MGTIDEAFVLLPSKIFSVLLLIALTGCTQRYDLIRTEAFVHYKIVDELTPPQKPNVVGFTRCSEGGICEIQILRDYYPECLEHEDRHIFEGDWHDDIPTNCR